MTVENVTASRGCAGAQQAKPYAQACERNRDPILDVLKWAFAESRDVLEIGSGTGQHAVYFACHLPHLVWHTSELSEQHPGIRAWIEEAQPPNVRAPLALNVNESPWPIGAVDAVFTANTLHIMSWPSVERMFAGIARVLEPGGIVCVYGPFNYDGRYTSPSNARFDEWLKARDPESGIRDFAAVDSLAHNAGLALARDFPMPANNRSLVWRRAG